MKYDATGREVVGFPTEEDVTVSGAWTFSNTVTFTDDTSPIVIATNATTPIEVNADVNNAVSIDLDNDNNGTSNLARVAISSGDCNLSVFVAGSGRSATTITGATASDAHAGLRTLAADPIYIGVDNTAVAKFGASAANPLSVTGSDATGDCWIGFYESGAFTTRKGYIGYGNAADNTFFIENEEATDGIRLRCNGSLRMYVNDTGVAFNGATPAARPDYTVTNPSTDRALNVSADTTAQVAAVLGTLIADLIAIGLLQ